MRRRRVVRVGVEGLRFEAIHYTSIPGEEPRLHGHSFRVDVEVEGVPDRHGILIDFRLLRSIVGETLRGWDEAILLPRGAEARVEGPFSVKFKKIDGEATTENIACTILDEVEPRVLEGATGSIHYIVVRVWESYDRYAECIDEVEAQPGRRR